MMLVMRQNTQNSRAAQFFSENAALKQIANLVSFDDPLEYNAGLIGGSFSDTLTFCTEETPVDKKLQKKTHLYNKRFNH